MKESIAGISIFQIVIVFIITFAGIMALTINHAKAFGVKDEIVTIIETSQNKNGKLSDGTINQIITKLGEVGYRATSKCEEGWKTYPNNETNSMSEQSSDNEEQSLKEKSVFE